MRRVRGKRCWSGGAQVVFPAPVEVASYESSMSSPSKMMLEQGNEYQSIHAGQHGGAYAANPSPAPPGYTGILDEGLRAQAAISPIDQSLRAIQGMSDQSGGRRRRGSRRMRGGDSDAASGAMEGGAKRRSRRGRKGSRRVRGGGKRKGSRGMCGGSKRKGSRRGRKGSRRMRGGAAYSIASAQDVGAPGMLLSPGMEREALSGMNPEWKLATDPNSFAPNLS